MAYLGEHLYVCNAIPFNWRQVELLVLSSSGPNVCGHAMLHAGNYYFHVDGWYGYPWSMNEAGFRRHAAENKKHVLQRIRLILPNPEGAQRKLEELSAAKWFWGVLPHNCASFVEAINGAGGSRVTSLANCPDLRWR